MSRKPTVIASLTYKRRGQEKQLRSLAKYLQFRDGSVRRESYLRGEGYVGQETSMTLPTKREPKWVDRGMGEGYQRVVQNARAFCGRSVLARTWVLSPDPKLMAHVPEHRRAQFMSQVTEKTVELWHTANGWDIPEYSYVIHDRKTNHEGRQQIHAHIISPGTIPVEPGLGRMDHYVQKPHLLDLRRTVEQIFEEELFRELGAERAIEVLLERESNEMVKHHTSRSSTLSRTMALSALINRYQSRKYPNDAHLRMYARFLNREKRQRERRSRVEQAQVRELQFQENLKKARLEEKRRREKFRRDQQRTHHDDLEHKWDIER